MDCSPQNVAIFQFIFIDQEIASFIQAVTNFSFQVQKKITSLEAERKIFSDSSGTVSPLLKKNFLFTHSFKFNIDRMNHFSNDLQTLFIREFHRFKKVISEISYRIIKGILRKKIILQLSHLGNAIDSIVDNIMDRCQVRISIEPFNLPFEFSGFRNLDGTLSIGHHIFLTGRVTNVEPPMHIIIRRLYRCKNPDCRNTFYLHFNDTGSLSNIADLDANCSSVYCDKCNELASEDETGRIVGSFQKFFVSPFSLAANYIGYHDENLFFSDFSINYNFFSFFPQVELKLKDFNRDSNYRCPEILMVGKVIDVIGTTMKHNTKIICEPNFSFQNLAPKFNDSSDYFNNFLSRIKQFFPCSQYHGSFLRIATAALCAVSSSSQLLFIVKSSEDMKILIRFLVECVLEPNDCDVYLPNEKSLIKNNLQNFAKNQSRTDEIIANNVLQPQLPGLLSRKSIIIYHLESISSKNQEKLKRIISQKSVYGCKLVQMTLIGILVSPEFDSNQISMYDTFPMIVRVESFPRKLFINLFVDSSYGFDNLFGQADESSNKKIFSRAPEEESFVLQLKQEYKKVTISEEGQSLIDNYLAYIDRNSNLSENQIESVISDLSSSNASMVKFANSGLNISPGIIADACKAFASIRGDQVASECEAVMSIYFFEERLTALTAAEDNELDQFPPSSGNSFFSPGLSAIPSKDEGLLFNCYSSILNRIITE